MDKDKRTQEELSKEFNVIGGIAFDYASDAYKPQVREVCRQIREIVDEHFRWSDMKLSDYEKGKIDTRQKATVTREEVALLAYSLVRDIDVDGHDDDEGFQEAVGDAGSTIEHWLKELSVEVE